MTAKDAIVGAVFLGALTALAGPAPTRADLVGHGGMVRAVAVSPDGSGAVTVGDDRLAIQWDLAQLKPKRRFAGHEHKIMSVAVSPDGRALATAGWDKTLRLWDLASGAAMRALAHPSPLNAVAFAKGGRVVVAGDHNGALHAWDAGTGESLGRLEGHERGITHLAVASDGRRLLSASIDKTVRLWDLETRRELALFTHHDGPVYAVAAAPDGRAGVSAGREGFLVAWSLDDGKIVRQVRAHDRAVWSVALSPNGQFAVTGGADDVARVWHLGTGDRIGMAEAAPDEPKPWLTSAHPGAKLFTKCARCHALSANGPKRSGPHLAGLFGRRAGSIPGYRYSQALTGVAFEWNETTLFELFNRGPDVMLPGTKMPVQRVPNDEQLRQLIAYLKELTATKPN